MLDKFLVLLERFVAAHELLAVSTRDLAHNKTDAEIAKHAAVAELSKETQAEVVEQPAAEEKPKRKKAAKRAPEPEADDLADDEPEEKKPAKKEVDLTSLRDEIKQIAKHIAAGESDKCADLFDELLEEYGVRTVTKLSDEDVVKFHTDAKTLVAKYYDVEED